MRNDGTSEREFKETLRRAVKKFVFRSVFAYDGLFWARACTWLETDLAIANSTE